MTIEASSPFYPKRRWLKLPGIAVYLCALALLLLFTQLTRFENTLLVSVNPQTLSFRFGDSEHEIPISFGSTIRILAQTQQSVWGESYVNQASLQGIGGTEFSYHIPSLYLFGHNILRPYAAAQGNPKIPSFGDWTSAIEFSFKSEILKAPIPSAFEIKINILGRGQMKIFLEGDQILNFSLYDGFINNCYNACTETKCLVDRSTPEPPIRNVLRIANFFLEYLLVAVFISPIILRARCDEILFSNRIFLAGSIIIASLHLGFVFWTEKLLGFIPHVPDSSSYYRQSVLLKHKMLALVPPLEPIEAFLSAGTFVRDGAIFFKHNHFWPMVLSIGQFFGSPWIVNPALSLGILTLIYLISRDFFSRTVGIFAICFLALSPLNILMASDYLNHTLTAFLLLAGIYCTLRYFRSENWILALLSGFLVSYAGAVRPVTTLAFVVVMLIFIFIKKIGWRYFTGVLVGATPVLMLAIANNWYVSGNGLVSPYQSHHFLSLKLSNFGFGANWIDSTLGHLRPITGSWLLSSFFYSLPILAIIARRQYMGLFFAFLPALVLLHSFFNSVGIHGYGPRFLFEALPPMAIAAGVGMEIILRALPFRKVFLIFTLAIILLSGGKSLLAKLPHYEDYNSIRAALYREITQLDLENSIVILNASSWWDTEIVAAAFDPTYKNSFFIIELADNSHLEILKKFPEKTVYRVTVNGIETLREPLS